MPANRITEHRTTESKRGRGRPRSLNPLTAAQRAKRYRDNKRARQAADGGASGAEAPQDNRQSASGATASSELVMENARLQQALNAAHTRINDLTGALEFIVNARAKHRKITADQMKGLHVLLALGNPAGDSPLRVKRKR